MLHRNKLTPWMLGISALFFASASNKTNMPAGSPGSSKHNGIGNRQAPAQKTAKVDQVIILKVLQNVMKFDKEVLQVKAGTTVQIVFQNPDFMQHNFVLVKPKTMEAVGAAADKLAQDPDGAKLNYVPKMPEVLQSTPLLNPEGKFTLTFKAPATAGDYPYICTFPGHWRIMQGVMKVTK